jgi:hypothetical protein
MAERLSLTDLLLIVFLVCAVGLGRSGLGGFWGMGDAGWWRERAREVTGS